jgi:hypothetical protein
MRTRPADGDTYYERIEKAADGVRLYHNWAIDILPFLEEQPLYDSLVLVGEHDGQLLSLTSSNIPAIARPAGKAANANLLGRTTELETMLCPSDDGRGRPYDGTSLSNASGGVWARGNYAYNFGLGFPMSNRSLNSLITSIWDKTFKNEDTGEIVTCGRGIGGADIGMKYAQITDGTSKSIAILEIRTGRSPIDRRGVWAMQMIGSNILGQHGANHGLGPNDCQPGSDDIRDNVAIIAEAGEDSLRAECMLPYSSSSWNVSAQSTSRSTHPGGVFAAMCDGSVQFISDFVDAGGQTDELRCDPSVFGVWQRMNCPDDGYIVDNNY